MDLRSIENWHFTILIHLRPRDKHIPLRRRDIGCDKKSWSKNLPNISIVRIFFFSLSLSFVYLLTLRRSSKGICIIFNIVSSILFNHHRALTWCEKHRESVFFSTIVIFWEECIWYGVYNNSLYIYIFACSDRENYDHDNWFRYTLNFISSAWRIFDYLRFRVFTIHRSYRRETRRNAYWRRR